MSNKKDHFPFLLCCDVDIAINLKKRRSHNIQELIIDGLNVESDEEEKKSIVIKT